MKTVLIFAHECAPFHRPESTIGAQRPAQFSKWLPDFGWRAIVVCCDARHRRTARRFDLQTIGREAAMQVMEVGRDQSIQVPTPSLVSDGLLDAAAESFCSGKAARLPGARWLRKPLTGLKLLTGDYSQSWQPCALAAAEQIERSVRIDLCIAEHGPDASIFLARGFARPRRIPWIVDFRDPALLPFRGLGRAVYRRVLRTLLKGASGAINVTPIWSDADSTELGVKSVCIPNGFDPEEYGEQRPTEGLPVTLMYFGSILQPYQRVDRVLDALAGGIASGRFGPSEMRFVYRGRAAELVRRLAAERDLSRIVDSGEQIDRRMVLSMAATCDALLLLTVGPEAKNVHFASGYYPGKLFEYLGVGRPIVAAFGDSGLSDALLNETGAGTVVRTQKDLEDYLANAVERKRRGLRIGEPMRSASVSAYTRRAQAKKLADYLDATVLSRRSVEGG